MVGGGVQGSRAYTRAPSRLSGVNPADYNGLHASSERAARVRQTVSAMFQGLAGSLSTFVRAPGQPLCVHGIRCYRENRDHWQQYDHPAHHPRLAAPSALAGQPSSSSGPPADVIELSDDEDEPPASTALRSERERDVCTTLRGVEVPPGWSVVGGSLLVWSHLSPAPSTRIAAFDFDDTLAKTALGGFDPNAWTNLFPHVPAVLPVETPVLSCGRLTVAHGGRGVAPSPHAPPEPCSHSSGIAC